METTRSEGGPTSRFAAHWWACGLALHERTTESRPPSGSDTVGADRFTARLADAGLDEHTLAELLAESAEALAARTTRPAWAELIEAVVDAAPVEPAVDVDEISAATGVLTLAPVLRPLVTAAVDRLAAAIEIDAEIDLPAVYAGFADQLSGQLCVLAARTLVLETNLARASGRLAGADGRARFADFLRTTAGGNGLASLFGTYPVLARMLGICCAQAVTAHQEILARLVADRADITAMLCGGRDPGPLVAVSAGSGDRHRGGRSIALLRFANGTQVVYKPRSLTSHAHFNELIGWLNRAVPWFDLRTVDMVVRNGYGWQEFIAHTPCADVSGIERFYLREGALLALFYALDGTDIHHENVIACGDQPVFVDVETLFHPAYATATFTGANPATHALLSSVYRTTLLPTMTVGEHGVLDISGVGGDRDRPYPADVVGWADAGTDRMRMVRGPVDFAGSMNRPHTGGVDADPGEYLRSMMAGFRAAYDAIVAGRADLVGPGGRLESCADDEIRIVVRPTLTYAALLSESTEPDVLRDGMDRDLLFDALSVAPADDLLRTVTPYEIGDLWAGDIPVFHSRPGSRDIRTSGGDVLPDLLGATGIDAVAAKITRMDAADRGDQEWLIKATLACRLPPLDHASGPAQTGPGTASVPDRDRLLSSACAVADEIVAYVKRDGDRVNWLTMEQVDGRQWLVLPMGAGLANGYSGVALFLAQLGAATGIARYTDLARRTIRPLPELIRAVGADPDVARAIGCGGFLGWGGICYALARMATLLDDPVLSEWLAVAVPLIDSSDNGIQHDLATGRAGGLAAMLAVRAETGMAAADVLALTFAERLVTQLTAQQRDRSTGTAAKTPGDHLPTRGFLWGPTGIGWVLARFAASDGDRYAEFGRMAEFALELDLDIEPDSPHSLDDDPDYSWCSGLSGRLLAMVSDRHRRTDRWTSRATTYLDTIAHHRASSDMSLCHGELGVLESLAVLGSRGDDRAAAAAERGAAFLLGAIDEFGARCGTPGEISCAGLLSGLAGIGYGLLRLAMPTEVPSILLLEPSVNHERTS
ncbi:MAG TPA: type 2 lanthipeptide synthetase LanM family protein [Pseudonocardiaceae bacterium]|nr:type 2 lanthipeptide synthetase LanM family protein [Pseudonocardiaceae bacterium]